MPEVEKSSGSATSRRAPLRLHAKTKQKPAVPVKLSSEEEVRYCIKRIQGKKACSPQKSPGQARRHMRALQQHQKDVSARWRRRMNKMG